MKYASLSVENIGAGVESLRSYLESTSLGKADCIRIVFAVEEALLHFRTHFGEDTAFALTHGKRWGREQFSLSLRGEQCDPFTLDDDDEIPSITKSMMGQMGLFPRWRYAGGQNIISMVLPKLPSSPLVKLGGSIAAAFAIYAICLCLPAEIGEALYTYGVTPLATAFSGVLSAISGPIIFCSITYSICSMGDIGTFGKIGKRTVAAIFRATCFLTLISSFWLVLVYPPQVTGAVESDGNAFFEIYEMVLDIVPSNLMISFVDNNPMQIVVIAIVLGFALLAMQKTTALLAEFVAQINSALQFIMQIISSYIHVFVFLSVLGLLLSGQLSTLLDAYLFAVYLVMAMLIAIGYSVARACLKTGVAPHTLLKKVAPTFLIALATASSTAAFSTNITVCKKSLGISDRLVDFGVPFGQVIYMPAFALFFGVVGFYMYGAYDLVVSVPMLLMLFLLCVILSIALPPIPGGGLIVVNILCLQLGIPDAGLALAIIFLTIYDFPATALNVCSLQLELLCAAKDLDLLDDAVLKSAADVAQG